MYLRKLDFCSYRHFQVPLADCVHRRFTVQLDSLNKRLSFGRSLKITVSFSHEHFGIYEDRLELIFEDVNLNQRFLIARQLRAIIASPGYTELLPKIPFVPKKRTARDQVREIVAGDPPPALGVIRYIGKLPKALIPSYISSALKDGGSITNIIAQFRSSILPRSLEDVTYGRHFKALLWTEEYRSE